MYQYSCIISYVQQNIEEDVYKRQTQLPGGSVDWVAIGSAAIVAGVASLGTSLAGLPELNKIRCSSYIFTDLDL